MNKTLTEQELDLLGRLEEAGVAFMLYVGGGSIIISKEDVPELIANPDKFLADYHGVSVERYLAWRNFDGSCRATTAKGKPCTKRPEGASSPAAFVRGISDYCKHHQGYEEVNFS